MLINEKHLAELNSPVQTINARVELHNGSTLAQICTCNDYLANFTIERVGEGKFFGYGICHKLIAKFIDPDREINLTDIDFMEVTFGVDGEFIYPFPTFYVLEVNRDETTNELSVTAYDTLFQATNHTVSELVLPSSYNMLYFVSACAALLGISVKFENVKDISAFIINYDAGANFAGTETVRQALDAVAEATQTIYYLNGDWQLTFRRLDQDGAVATTITKEQYMELTSGADCKLGAITHTTELGDSITATIAEDGVTQYLRNNPFLELREDAGTILNGAIVTVGGLTINPFDCSWMGNYLLEIGDKVAFLAEDAGALVTYIVDDSITFDGTLGQHSRWEYLADEAETAENPATLGEALNQTYARVDKVNKRIDLVVSDVDNRLTEITADLDGIELRVKKTEEEVKAFEELETGQFVERVAEIEIELDNIQSSVSDVTTNISALETRVETAETNINQTKESIELRATKEELKSVDDKVISNTSSIGALEVNTQSISASVTKVENETKEQLNAINESIGEITKQASLLMTEEQVKIAIETELNNGVDKVTTSTGFTFNDEGLTVDKTDSEMKTKITEDGMTVYKNDERVLIANNKGVTATDLYATTYLIIGGKSRFENYERDGEPRTACFWIGTQEVR